MSYSASRRRAGWSAACCARARAVPRAVRPASAWTHHGCRLPPDGACFAASRMARTVSPGTGVSRKARQLNAARDGFAHVHLCSSRRRAILPEAQRSAAVPCSLPHSTSQPGGMSRGYKITLLAALYVAQGLPYGFFTQALPVLLRDAGLSLKAISATSLLFLPWALKFLWAPFVDHWGTRKAWLLPLQVAAVACALLLATLDLGHGYVRRACRGLRLQPRRGMPGHRDRRARGPHARSARARARQRPAGGCVPARHDPRRRTAAVDLRAHGTGR